MNNRSNHRTRPSRPNILFLGLLACLASGALGQGSDDEDVPIAPFRIVDSEGELGMRFDYLSEEQKRDEGDSIEISNRGLREYILMRHWGYVYHPRFLDFRTSFELGLLQQSLERSGTDADFGEEGDSNTSLYGYDIYLQFLKEHPLSLLLFANKDRRPVFQLFTDRQIVETEGYGAVFTLKEGPLPMSLTLSRRSIDEFGADSRSETDISSIDYVVRHDFRQMIETEMRYRYEDFSQDFRAENPLIDIERTTDLKSHDLSLINTVYFSPDRANHLSSVLRFYRQSGDQDLRSQYWQERLNLRHTPNFRTYYLASLLQNDFEDSTVRTLRGEIGADYDLFRSLTFHVDVHGRRTDFDELTEDQYGVTGRIDYRKETPWGYLTAGYARTMDEIKRGGFNDRLQIVDEEVIVNDDRFNFLSRTEVFTETINITDATGTIEYIEDFDYEIREIGRRIGIRVLPGGRLAPLDRVLVDYDVSVSEALNYSSDLQDFHFRYAFYKWLQGLAVYYRYRDLAADGVDADIDNVLVFTDHIYGFEYRWRWLTWIEEYETYDSNFSIYSQLRSQIEGTHALGNGGLRFGWFAGMLNVDYDDEELDPDYSDQVFGGIRLNGRLRNQGFWEVEARAREEEGLVDETVLGLAAKLGWRWRKVRVESGLRLENLERESLERDRVHVFLGIAREFGR